MSDVPNTYAGIRQAAAEAGARFPDVVAAQWALESGYGRYPAARNNFWGQTAVGGGFESYGSIREGLQRHVDLWHKPFANAGGSSDDAISRLVAAGYNVEDPQYSTKLARIIGENGGGTSPVLPGAGIGTGDPANDRPEQTLGGRPQTTQPHNPGRIPAFKVTFNGENITSRLGDRVLSIVVTDHAGQEADTLELALDDRDRLLPVPPAGSELKVALGYRDRGRELVDMGTFIVDEVELSAPPRSMTIQASAILLSQTLVQDKLNYPWNDKRFTEIAAEIAERNGLELKLGKVNFDPTYRHLDQTHESDQSFLTDLAWRTGNIAKPVDGKLAVTGLAFGSLGATVSVRESSQINWSARVKSRGRYTKVKAKWVDRTEAKEKVAEAEAENADGQTWHIQEHYQSEEEAKAAAGAKLATLSAGTVSVDLDMPGWPELVAEGTIKLEGFRPEIDKSWPIRQVTHSFDESGFRTSIAATNEPVAPKGWGRDEGGIGRAPGAGDGDIAGAADRAVGTNTAAGPDNGNQACLWAVNNVLRDAGVTPPWGNSNYVPDARAALAGGAGVKLSGPEPGAIAIMRDNGNPPYPHIGIVGSDGRTIHSNSSSRRSFSWSAPDSSYQSTYGRPSEFWRLK